MANDKNALDQRTAKLLTSSWKAVQEKEKGKPDSPTTLSIEEQLAQAKASRNQAETARQKIANEILEATKEVCQKLITDGEQTLERAKKLEAEAERKHLEAEDELNKARIARGECESYAEKVRSEAQKQAQEKLDHAQRIRQEAEAYREKVMAEVQQQAQEQLDQAQTIRHDADAYREKVLSEAKEQGQEILYLARSAAEQECNELKQQAAVEVQRTIAEAELIKVASQEELEAQRIYSEAARLETESLEILAQVRAKLGAPNRYQQTVAGAGGAVLELIPTWQHVGHGEDLPVVDEAPPPAEEPQSSPESKESKAGKSGSTSRRR